ncbi:porin [Burkholderia thailandensis]|uniref:porin n=1 Tax=Burkholderia thailandensis TaxID=57975 RepID=UPI001378BDF5|nr:porin [Burkholderia thailandensis]NBJ20601.1 porin [Burkholderia thailandensis]
MNKRWGIVAPAVVLAAAAHAQSSVMLYGKIEDGINYTSNARGHGTVQLQSGYDYGSRWGLKGTEDLGGGYKAIFQLENGFDVNNGRLGQGNREFGRQAFVGIASERYGTLTFGRQYDPSVDMFSPLTANGNWTGYLFAHPYDNDNTDYSFRVNNAVKYVSPTWNGVTAEGMYAVSNQAGGFANHRLRGAALQYRHGGLTLGASYVKMNNARSTDAAGAVTGDNTFDASSQQNIGIGATYEFSNALIGFAYSHVDVYDPTANAYFTGTTQPAGGRWKSWKFDNFEINGLYHVTPAFYVGAAYTYTQARVDSTVGAFNPKWHQLSMKLDYDLSKRSSVFVEGVYQHAMNAHTGTDFDYAYIPGAADIASGPNQYVVRLALLHQF